MTYVMPTMENDQDRSTQDDMLELAFGLGWATADESHLPSLPEALAQVLNVPAVRMSVVHWNGTPRMTYAHPLPEDRQGGTSPMLLYEVEENLGNELTLRLSIETVAELSNTQVDKLNKAARLIHTALDCILVRQRDREALGEPFATLSDREWKICLALEGPDGEKQIASSLECSRHTMHGHIKRLYRKLLVQSRLQMLDQLRLAREQMRRGTLETYASAKSGFLTNKTFTQKTR